MVSGLIINKHYTLTPMGLVRFTYESQSAYRLPSSSSSLARQSLVDPGLLEEFYPFISIEGGVLPSLNP